MKTPVLIVAALTILLSGVPANAQTNMTGHVWREVPEVVKLTYVKAFMDGYSTGYATGALTGFAKTVAWAKTKTCGESDVVCKQLNNPSESVTSEVFASGSLAVKFGGYKISYYVGEVDSFYEAYPLCRGEDLSVKMLEFVFVWSTGTTSYQEMGTKCGAKK